MSYFNKTTGLLLPFKTQFTKNPNEGLITEFGPSKTVSTDYEPIRKLVNRVKNGEIHLLSNFLDEFTDDERTRDLDTLPLDVTSPEELYEDITDVENVRNYAEVLAGETSERSTGNNEAQNSQKQTLQSEEGEGGDEGADDNDDAQKTS